MLKHYIFYPVILIILQFLPGCQSEGIKVTYKFSGISNFSSTINDVDVVIRWAIRGNPVGTVVVEKSIEGSPFVQIGSVDINYAEFIDVDASLVSHDTQVIYRAYLSGDRAGTLTGQMVVNIPEYRVTVISYGRTPDNSNYSKGIFQFDGSVWTKTSLVANDNAITDAIDDTFIMEDDPCTVFGTTSYQCLPNSNNNSFLLKFSDFNNQIISAIGSGRKIKRATIYMYLYGTPGTYMVYNAITDWIESGAGEINWTNTGGAATFIGGLAPTATATYSGIATSDHKYGNVIDVTDIVQSWINGSDNYGLLMQTETGGCVGFKTREYGTPPILEIEYYDSAGYLASLL
jgi:hypothetical protein